MLLKEAWYDTLFVSTLTFFVPFPFSWYKLHGFLILQIILYTGNVSQMLDTLKTNVNIIDDCGNIWVCELTFATIPYEHFKIGGHWKKVCGSSQAPWRCEDQRGFPMVGSHDTIYVDVIYFFVYYSFSYLLKLFAC